MTTVVQVTTHPFGASGVRSREILESSGFEIHYNPFGRRLKPREVLELVREACGIVAGTEPYTQEVIEQAPHLKVIARVGAGIDNVDIETCRRLGVVVTYTPDAPADAVAELTVANIINLFRRVHESDRSVRERVWNRFLGHLVRELRIGILGVGRIGKRVIRLLQPFQAKVYGCDIRPDLEFGEKHGLTWLDRHELFATCDLVSVHVPLTEETYHLVGEAELHAMKPGGFLINTSRGSIVDEKALVAALNAQHLAGAAIDVFETEPYEGPLTHLPNVVLTAHMGASAHHSRYLMELGAAEDCIRVLTGRPPLSPVQDADLARK